MAAIAFSYTLEVWPILLLLLLSSLIILCLLISSFINLQVLELDNCNLLTSVSLDLARLQNIRLVHCRKYDTHMLLLAHGV